MYCQVSIRVAMLAVASVLFCIGASAQDDVVVWGGGDWLKPEFILRYQVLDSQTHIPVVGAKVSLDAGGRTMTLHTNQNGVGIVIVMRQDNFTTGTVSITASGYQFYEHDQDYWDLRHASEENLLKIHGQTMDWSATSRPSFEETVNALRHQGYEVLQNIDYHFSGPGLYEFVVLMQSAGEKHDYFHETRIGQNHQRDKDTQVFVGTEWKLECTSTGEVVFLKFDPGELLLKEMEDHLYRPSDVNWWMEDIRLFINFGNYNRIVFDLGGEGGDVLYGINTKDQEPFTLKRIQ